MAILCIALLRIGVANADDPKVTITGGRDASGQNYAWTVVNGDSRPIIAIEIPHYHADTFIPPKGWGQECTNLQHLNARDEPGVCRAVAPPGGGLRTNESAALSIRIAQVGTFRGTGAIKITFQDGQVATIDGVDLPCAPSFLGQFIYPIGIALILGGALLWKKLRKPKSSAAESTAETGTPTA